MNNSEGMIQKFLDGEKAGIDSYSNRKPKWDDKCKGYVLNFYNRVACPSIKNF